MNSLPTPRIVEYVREMNDQDLSNELNRWANKMISSPPLVSQTLQEQLLYSIQYLLEAATRLKSYGVK